MRIDDLPNGVFSRPLVSSAAFLLWEDLQKSFSKCQKAHFNHTNHQELTINLKSKMKDASRPGKLVGAAQGLPWPAADHMKFICCCTQEWNQERGRIFPIANDLEMSDELICLQTSGVKFLLQVFVKQINNKMITTCQVDWLLMFPYAAAKLYHCMQSRKY